MNNEKYWRARETQYDTWLRTEEGIAMLTPELILCLHRNGSLVLLLHDKNGIATHNKEVRKINVSKVIIANYMFNIQQRLEGRSGLLVVIVNEMNLSHQFYLTKVERGVLRVNTDVTWSEERIQEGGLLLSLIESI